MLYAVYLVFDMLYAVYLVFDMLYAVYLVFDMLYAVYLVLGYPIDSKSTKAVICRLYFFAAFCKLIDCLIGNFKRV